MMSAIFLPPAEGEMNAAEAGQPQVGVCCVSQF